MQAGPVGCQRWERESPNQTNNSTPISLHGFQDEREVQDFQYGYARRLWMNNLTRFFIDLSQTQTYLHVFLQLMEDSEFPALEYKA